MPALRYIYKPTAERCCDYAGNGLPFRWDSTRQIRARRLPGPGTTLPQLFGCAPRPDGDERAKDGAPARVVHEFWVVSAGSQVGDESRLAPPHRSATRIAMKRRQNRSASLRTLEHSIETHRGLDSAAR